MENVLSFLMASLSELSLTSIITGFFSAMNFFAAATGRTFSFPTFASC